MTLREKIGRLFWIRPDVLDETLQSTAADPEAPGLLTVNDRVRTMLKRYPVGGFVIFAKNLRSPAQLRGLTAGLASCVPDPVFAVDEEGGRVARLGNCSAFGLPQYPPMLELGAQGTDAVYTACRTIGGYLKEYGFTLNFAPVADVNTNPANPVIGRRALSGDPAAAAKLITAAVHGYHDAGMACTLKHFPGHGDTAQDSHLGFASTDKTWQQMRGCELLPFAAGIAAGADAVMTAHITAANADTGDLPASLSYKMLTERLRGELGFDGLTVTDSLGMKAVSGPYGSGRAALMALEAGADVLLMPADLPDAFEAVLAAAESGRIGEQRIDASLARIDALKKRYAGQP